VILPKEAQIEFAGGECMILSLLELYETLPCIAMQIGFP
jgi:hypothetical protein